MLLQRALLQLASHSYAYSHFPCAVPYTRYLESRAACIAAHTVLRPTATFGKKTCFTAPRKATAHDIAFVHTARAVSSRSVVQSKQRLAPIHLAHLRLKSTPSPLLSKALYKSLPTSARRQNISTFQSASCRYAIHQLTCIISFFNLR